MLSSLHKLSPMLGKVVIHSPSAGITLFARTRIKEGYAVLPDYIIDVNKKRDFDKALGEALVAPMLSLKWVIHVDVDDFSKKELFDAIKAPTGFAVVIYWTKDYRTYRTIQDAKEFQALGHRATSFSYSRLSASDIVFLYGRMTEDTEFFLEKKILDYVAKTYTFDVDAVYELFLQVRSGREINTRRDVISAVGVAGNSVSALAVKLLRISFSDEKGRRKAYGALIRAVDDLSVSLPYEKIRMYLQSTIRGFMDIKQLEMMGIYGRVGKEVPEVFDINRLNRLRRFDRFILSEVGMPRLLNLYTALTNASFTKNADAKLGLMQALSWYMGSVSPLSEKEKEQRQRKFLKARMGG